MSSGDGPVLGLVVTGLVVMGSPGPSTVSLVAVSAAYGARRALVYGVGLVLGTVAVLLAVATGATAVLLALPALRWLVLALAAGYVLWLAVRLASASALDDHGFGVARPSVRGGVLLGALNPKAWVGIGAVFLSARVSETPTADAVIKAVVLTAPIVVIHAGWLAAGGLLAT